MDNNMLTVNSGGGRRPRRGRLVAGVALASVLAGGAAFGAVTMVNAGPASASPASPASPAGQAALLNSALTSAASPATTVADTAGRRHLRGPLARLRRLGGIDGQFTFETKKGPRTIAFERGTIASVANGEVAVRAKDGTTWDWKLVSDSVVRENGKKTTTSALSAGELVFVGGPVLSGTHDARLIVIGTPGKPTTSGTTSATGTA